jgi:hypothetical protein
MSRTRKINRMTFSKERERSLKVYKYGGGNVTQRDKQNYYAKQRDLRKKRVKRQLLKQLGYNDQLNDKL